MKKFIAAFIAVLITVSLGILIPSCGKDEDEEYIIRDNVELPEDNTELLEVQVNGDSLTFIYKAGSTVPFYDPGDILVGEKAGGYLKEVQSTVISGDTLHVLSEQAALTDAIEMGSIDTIIALQLQGQLMSPIIFDTIIQGKSGKSYRCYLTGGQPQLIPMGELFEIRIPDITIDIMSGSNVAVRVHVDTLVLTKSIDIDLNLIIDGGAIEVFRLVADATDEVRFAGTTMDVYQTISDDIELLLMNLNLGTVVIWIGPVPVVLLFNFDIYAGVDASVTVSAHILLSNTVSLVSENQVGAEYANGDWQAINDWSLSGDADYDFDPTASITATLSEYLRGDLSVKIYGIMGPSLYLKPYQYNTLSYPPLDLELGIGLGAGLQFSVQILSWLLVDYHHTFVDYTESMTALVEFGMYDCSLMEQRAGDLGMRVLKIELPYESIYVTVWEGVETVQVPLESYGFVTITNGNVGIEPNLFGDARVTIDSLIYVQTSTVLIDTSITFIAEAFVQIIIEGGDELPLVIDINSGDWFDEDSVMIIPGHDPFEGASLSIYYGY